MYISIQVITLEKFSMSHHSSPLLASDHVSRHAVVNPPPPDDRKKYDATPSAHSKLISEMLQNRKVFFLT